jgi:hypothetical protein
MELVSVVKDLKLRESREMMEDVEARRSGFPF